MAQPPVIYNRHDPAKRYNRHLFLADRVLQSAELNEVQSEIHGRLRGLGDVLFKEGGIVRAAGIVVNHETGATLCESGAVYVDGAVRGVPPGQLTVPVKGIVLVGVYITRHIVTELDDPALRNPAPGTRGYNQGGAARERIDIVWGFRGDGQAGDFFPIWTVEDGYVRPKEPPPNLDAVTQALARYDRDSAGGTYIVRGLRVMLADDLATGEQSYTLTEGAARVGGQAITLPVTRRITYAAKPDVQWVDAEQHMSAGASAQVVAFDRWPVVGTPEVRIVARKTATVIHGGFTGVADPLPDTSVMSIERVWQGGTEYAQGADYKLTAGQVDWSPGGAEPAPGSSYQVTYRHYAKVEPTAHDARTVTVTGALADTPISLSYNYALRRIDALCLSGEGDIVWVQGVAAPWVPKAPVIPPDLLALAHVHQRWDDSRQVRADGVRVVPMDMLVDYGRRLDSVREDLAEVRLAVDVSGRHAGVRKGLFADPMMSNSMRDNGVMQTGAILGGALILRSAITVHDMPEAPRTLALPEYTQQTVLAQPMRTGAKLVNPYQAFDPLPAPVLIDPQVDRWTETKTQWQEPITEWVEASLASDTPIDRLLSEVAGDIRFLRQISVRFELRFGPGENLAAMSFGGVAVQAEPLPGGALVADGTGLLQGRFTIPPNMPAGTHIVLFEGTGGSHGGATFVGKGTLVERSMVSVNLHAVVPPPPPPPPPPAPGQPPAPPTPPAPAPAPGAPPPMTYFWSHSEVFFVDPLAQTFTLREARQVSGVRLWFTVRGTHRVMVQLRDVENGFPGRRILQEVFLDPGQIATGGATTVQWAPVLLEGNREYAVVVLTDDAECALAVATLGEFDQVSGRWVTSQPYQVGVLLSSSNASTWTAHQDQDMAFELLSAQYTPGERTIDCGEVQVVQATDFMVQAVVRQPSAAARGRFTLHLADRDPIEVAAGQVVQLASRYTGAVRVKAHLSATEKLAAALEPGVQLVAGALESEGTYVTPMLPAGGNARVRVLLRANLPAGSGVQVHVQSQRGGAWTAVPFYGSSPATAGAVELEYELPDYAAQQVSVRLTLAGTPAARPQVRDLRVVVL